jgi:hypothetical protein
MPTTPACRPRRAITVCFLTLESRQCNALDEVLLGEEEDEDGGEGHEEGAGHEHAPFGGGLPESRLLHVGSDQSDLDVGEA